MARELVPGVHLLELGFWPPLRSSAFLVRDGETTLVDAGLPVNYPRLRTEVRRTGVAISDLDRVLLTHYDLDHVGGLARLVPELDAPVYVGRADLDLLRGHVNPPALHHKGLFHRGLRRIHRLPADLDRRPVDDGDRIGGFVAFHTPGHNPGHVAYIHPELRAAFLGDLVWARDGALTPPIQLDSYDMAELRESVTRLAADAPPFDLACVGHGDPLLEGGHAALQSLATRFTADEDVSE